MLEETKFFPRLVQMKPLPYLGCLIFSIVFCSGVFAQNTSEDVNELFVEALKTHRLAMEQDGEKRAESLLQVLQLFSQVSANYPDHRLAGLIKRRTIPNVNFDELIPVGWNEGKRGIARDLLAAYDNDIDVMRSVGNAAVYALLSAATYDHEDGQTAKERARQLGWTESDIPAADSFIVGGAKASLFTKGNLAVLAFRGSTTTGDWITNGSTVIPVPLAGEQVIDAISLAVAFRENHPNLVLTGHSLGGRLAQASRRVIDVPAYVFNSAPVGLPELSVLGVANLIANPQAPLQRFRHPQDQLSGVAPANDIEVENIFEASNILTLNPLNNATKTYFHDIDVLYRAMENVRQAHDLGWLSAYLIDLPLPDGGDATEEIIVADGQRWGPSIVPADTVELGYRPCGDRTDIRRCLEEKGLGKDAIDFSFAVAGDLVGEVFAKDFLEAGEIDVAHVEFNGASPHRWPILLNGSVGEITLETTNDLAAVFTDPTSRKMLGQFPQAISRSAQIRSNRLLEDGTQRFVLVETIIDGCRACPILGNAVTFLEIGPATGGTLKRTPIGLSIRDPSDNVDLSHQVLRERPDSLQTILNVLGYNAGEMDGYPGPQTRNALMAFQAERCLPATGQPDSATAAAIVAADGFEMPCSGKQVPNGVAANTPLLAGKYVRDLAQCEQHENWDLLWEQIFINGTGITLGHENPCETRRTDIRNGVTLFRGSCSWVDATREASWRLDLRSNSEFVFLSQENTFGNLEPALYKRCEDLKTEVGGAKAASAPTEDGTSSGITFVFQKEELDQVAALSNDGELRSTGFNVEISDDLSVNCTHWVPQGAGAPSEYGITTWDALLPKLQCNVWSDNGDGSSGLVPNTQVTASFDTASHAMVLTLDDTEVFLFARQGSQAPCVFSVQNQVHQYKREWQVECQVGYKETETAHFEPERGSELRKNILEAVRPIAEEHFGPPVEFVVNTMRVLNGKAYVEFSAQRPNGVPIDIRSTPAAGRGAVDFGVGNAHVVSGFLTEQEGDWRPSDIVIQATEAWWVGNCTGLEGLMPETCGSRDSESRPIQPAGAEISSTPAAIPNCAAEWVTTSNGCKACVERPEGWLRYMQKTADPSTRWSGACENGLIEGQGVLTWYSGEDEGWRTIFNARYPAVAGVPAFELRPSDVTVRYATNLSDGTVGYGKECIAVSDAVHDVSPLLLIVDASIPLANPEVHKVVMEEAQRIALADCEKERQRVSIRKEVSRFKVYSINFARSNHPRIKPFVDTDRPIPGGDLYRILPGCGFRPWLSGISECFKENPITNEIRQQVIATNQSRAQAIRQAERLRAEQAAQAEKARQQARIAAIRQEIEQNWAAHMDDVFTGQYVIQNVGDLLQYNKARAISLLSQGVTLQLATANMNFQDGTVIISHEHDPTDVLKPVRDAARAEMGTWEQWFDTTASVGRDYSGPSINVTCRLDASALEQLDGKSTARFSATMQSLNGRSAIFDCELKR